MMMTMMKAVCAAAAAAGAFAAMVAANTITITDPKFHVVVFGTDGEKIAEGDGEMRKTPQIVFGFAKGQFTVEPKARRLGNAAWGNAKSLDEVLGNKKMNFLSDGNVLLMMNANNTVTVHQLASNQVAGKPLKTLKTVTVAKVVVSGPDGKERVFDSAAEQLEATLEHGVKFQIPPEILAKSGQFESWEFAALVGALSTSTAAQPGKSSFKMATQADITKFLNEFFQDHLIAQRKAVYDELVAIYKNARVEKKHAEEIVNKLTFGVPVYDPTRVEKPIIDFDKWQRRILLRKASIRRDENFRSIGAIPTPLTEKEALEAKASLKKRRMARASLTAQRMGAVHSELKRKFEEKAADGHRTKHPINPHNHGDLRAAANQGGHLVPAAA